jgi:hypothetical protein
MYFRTLFVYVVFLLAVLFWGDRAFGQSYGLGFAGQEVYDQDARTRLDLSPGKALCLDKDFELSFEFSFLPGYKTYFGYIMRIINEHNKNIDFIYDNLPGYKARHFKVVIGDQLSGIQFNIDSAQLFSKWNTVRLRFNATNRTLTFNSGKLTFTQYITPGNQNCIKLLFGAHNYLNYKNSDLPAMKLRNIQIREKGKIRYHWPLDEYEGNTARELIQAQSAEVHQPHWIKQLHYRWRPEQNIKIAGRASVAFNAEKEIIYIVGAKSLLSYHIPGRELTEIRYRSGQQILRIGNQSLYDTVSHQLINFSPDEKWVSLFNFKQSSWDKKHLKPGAETDYWHVNKFYSAIDTALYTIGGYGHLTYKNTVRRYHFPSGGWINSPVSGNFTPRYLAALGQTADGAYIIGGYGSSTGKQILNPRNLYDLVYFDTRKKSFKKLYELDIRNEDFVFANSLVLNEKTRSYYALIFPKHKNNAQLQLIKGSLEKPVYQAVGSPIPYIFQDIRSFADLYYCPSSRRFVAVTLLRNENQDTQVKIYSLYAPPIAAVEKIEKAHPKTLYIILPSLLGIMIIAGILLYLKRQKAAIRTIREPAPDGATQSTDGKAVLLLFGDMQIFDQDATDLTKYFTPLIKELFLLILLNTLRGGRGVSSDKLNELFWLDKTIEHARNSRSVNLKRLKSILSKLKNCDLTKETGYWKINIDPGQVWIDYREYLGIIQDKRGLNKEKIAQLAGIIERGGFLSSVEYEWLDAFKSNISQEITDTYLHFAKSITIEEDPEFLVKITTCIFHFDPVNEDAMILKCKSLAHLGMHSLAKNTFEAFCKEYKTIYDENFPKDFHTILGTTFS